MPNKADLPAAGAVAAQLAGECEERNIEYAVGGAIALGFWGKPRGTVDVDITLFVPRDQPTEAVWQLQEIGCEVAVTIAIASLRQHGFCRATCDSLPIDVFVPTIPFYEHAKARRRRVYLGDRQVNVLDAETLAVFKMMFFRPQDLLDLRQVLRMQGTAFDRVWVREQLIEIVGPRDARMAQWDELAGESEA